MDADEVSNAAVSEDPGLGGLPRRGGGTVLYFAISLFRPTNCKLKGLKSAYADILLGISQEAGARVMEADRKSARCKYEMEATRDEGVRLLQHLKHMMESKITESQATALNQQKKIDELEAQLQEAEDIVSDLRGELRYVQGELDRVIKTRNSNESILQIPQMNGNNNYSYQSLVPHPSQLNGCGKCCNKMVCTCGGPRYLPSIILRRKETGLYRNGCTQRIRACDRNSLDQDLSLLEKDVRVNDKEKGSKEIGNKPLDNKLGVVDSFPMKRKRDIRLRKKSHLSKEQVFSDGNPCETNLVEARDQNTVHKDNVKMDVEKVDGQTGQLGGSELNSLKVTTNGSSGRPVRERDFKITFQRRRKREVLSKLEDNASLEMGKKIGDGETTSLDAGKKTGDGKTASLSTGKETGDGKTSDQKPEEIKRSLSLESAQESRRLALVARQLLSLSKSKW